MDNLEVKDIKYSYNSKDKMDIQTGYLFIGNQKTEVERSRFSESWYYSPSSYSDWKKAEKSANG